MFARCGAASWFSAWHWQRLRPMPAWGVPPPVAEAALDLQPELAAAELVLDLELQQELAAAELVLELELQQEPALAVLELRPEQGAAERELAGAAAAAAAEQFIARMAKLS
jgi:hypothetical protein